MTTSIVLLMLALGWCAYLAVWWKDSRKVAASRTDAISTFTSGMGSLGGSAARTSVNPLAGRPYDLMPRSAGAAARRRQEVFTGLGALAVLSLLASLVIGPIALLAHVIIDCTLVAYAYAVVQRRNEAAEREIKVQMLYPEGVTPLHDLRRTVNA
jgi:Flp pilus assembly protein TadB